MWLSVGGHDPARVTPAPWIFPEQFFKLLGIISSWDNVQILEKSLLV
jgi:hypothetical protein